MVKHTLIVDDDDTMRMAMAVALRRSGYRVSSARDREEALDVILNGDRSPERVDFVLVDLQMPGASGMKLVEELKRKASPISVFAVSGFTDKAFLIKLLSSGCTDFIEKTVEVHEHMHRVGDVAGDCGNGNGKERKHS